MQATIKDVAHLAGVSIGTVDRVLHNRGRVSENNKLAVEKAVEALNYKPSQIARALSVRKSNIRIGISCPKVEQDFWSEAISGIEHSKEKLLPFGIELVLDITNSYESDDQIKSIRRLLEKNVTGILLTPVKNIELQIDDIIPNHIPFATVIDDIPKSRRLFHVGPDEYAMGRLMAKLVTLYNTQLHTVILAPNINFTSTQQRITGFQSKLHELNVASAILQISEVPSETEKISYQSIYDITLNNISAYPNLNAVYVTNGLTQWAAAAVKAAGKQGSIGVFGHEYTSLTEDFINNDIIIATIYQKPAQQWYLAVNMLYEILIDDRELEEPLVWTECSIITKETLPLTKIGNLGLV